MGSPRVLGLAWTVLLVGVTAGAAQTTPDRTLPPIRLPGIVYPERSEAAPTLPEQRSKGQRSQPAAGPVTPASSPGKPPVAAEPQPPRKTVSLSVINEPDTTATVSMASEAGKPEEPLGLSTPLMQQFISPDGVSSKGVALAGSFAFACASLGSALLASIRRYRAWAS
jgi:hypothetical protein